MAVFLVGKFLPLIVIASLIQLTPTLGQECSRSDYCMERDGMSHGNNSIIRITELNRPKPLMCCSSFKRDSIEWFFPDGTSAMNISFTENGSGQNCSSCLDCVTPPLTTGVFHCNISSTNDTRKGSLYIGIYNSTHGGNLSSVELVYSRDSSSITCTSVGGPATNVTWTSRQMDIGGKERQTQIVLHTENATYLNILNISGLSELVGEITCNVSNNGSSDASTCIVLRDGAVRINDGSSNITLTEKQSYDLTCSVPGSHQSANYSFVWMRDIAIDSLRNCPSSTRCTHNISSPSLGDSGTYYCIVMSSCMAESINASVVITVEAPPPPSTPPSITSTIQVVTENSTATLPDSVIIDTATTSQPTKSDSGRSVFGRIPLIAVIALSVGVVLIIALCIPIIIILQRCLKKDKPIEIKQINISQPLLGHEQGLATPTISEAGSAKVEMEMLAVSVPAKTERSNRDRDMPVPVADFFKYVEQMHVNRDKLFEEEFNSLNSEPQYPHDVSQLTCNKEKNRFINIFPYDYNRVKLNAIPSIEGSDYVNASFLNGYRKQGVYIAAQGPLANTLEDFWRMVWEYRLPTIVMLTKCFEERAKCERYWPENKEEDFNAGTNFIVKLVAAVPFSEFVIRRLTVECATEPKTPPLEVNQFHYTAWPDHGVPSNTSVMINIIKRIRKLHPYTETRPLLVHCSAGVGRTGTFVVLDTMLERMKKEKSLNVYEFVKQLRTERVFLVQSMAQYMFVHDSLKEYTLCGETEILAPDLGIAVNKLRKIKRGVTGFEQQFQMLEKLCPKLDKEYFTNANEKCNVSKNRYQDKVPCDGFCRVSLRWTGQQGSDYINASYIDGYKRRKVYIAAQCPLESTVDDFWRMIWEQKSTCLVMLCDLEEDKKEMSVHFWPADDEPQVYGKVTVKKLSQSKNGNIVMRTFEVDSTNQSANYANIKSSFTITLFQFLAWKEHECPSDVSSLLDLVENVNKAQMKSGSKPLVVMCNDAVGRSGTFICIHAVLERLKTEGTLDFFQCVKSLRLQRPSLVLDVSQYELCHTTLLQYLQSCDDYANFKDVM